MQDTGFEHQSHDRRVFLLFEFGGDVVPQSQPREDGRFLPISSFRLQAVSRLREMGITDHWIERRNSCVAR